MQEAAITIVRTGFGAELQHLGRPGLRGQGMPAGGAMDALSLQAANLLCGNERGAPALELALGGARLRVDAPEGLLAAICGADMPADLDGVPLPSRRAVYVPSGGTISLGAARSGCRAYLAVAGGFAAPADSRAAGEAGSAGGIGRRLAAGEALRRSEPTARGAALLAALAERAAEAGGGVPTAAAPWLAPRLVARGGAGSGTVLRAVPGAAYGQLAQAARQRLWRERLAASPASDRMGVRLVPDAHPIELERRAELRSHGVLPGAVQLPPGGHPVVLAAGCQTTGGYPVILHVIAADLPRLGQLRPGDEIRFSRVELEEAQRLLLRQQRELDRLEAALRLRTERFLQERHRGSRR
ncbi:biotin-dependent carboxyltransferase family protein [Paenibacillus albicereus]|uniref:Biotin-dependent carboxyltransferase family protein n=1 Tax=Paenibacillus albicereus TaxID=2726185 RepID=A0A6H2GV79_9BACL|nr:biotin-dependent carboxyltransferase family protein [Paenibacillus albicereus]QJC51333.1 biotin-dependent carboxyltransferase family protein [Paenibacillus albicereus]